MTQKMFLVTSPDQRTWKTDGKILFAGEWCRLYREKEVWRHLDHEVLSYRWDDRAKFDRDYCYINDVYERYLSLMQGILNEVHGTRHSERYWRIVLGPWLRWFIEVFFDRYQAVVEAAQYAQISGTRIISGGKYQCVPNDFGQYIEWSLSDTYNQHLFSRIIRELDLFPYEEIPVGEALAPARKVEGLRMVLNWFLHFYSRLVPDALNRMVIETRYFPIFKLIQLQLSLGNIPFPYLPSIDIPKFAWDEKLRGQLQIYNNGNKFEQLLATLLFEQMPAVYLEGYHTFKDLAMKAYPKKPVLVYSDNMYIANEGFKFWAAAKVEEGTKLVGSPHGGIYGTGLHMQKEDHELAIVDKYFTWGWKRDGGNKTVPIASGKLANAKMMVKGKPSGKILWVLSCLPRYSIWLFSAPQSSQWFAYYGEQERFVKAVVPDARKLLLVRLSKPDYEWCQRERMLDADSSLEISQEGETTVFQAMNGSRIVVLTVNSTIIHEAFAANFPMLIFWHPSHFEIRPSARPYFDELHRVGILHYTPESAAKKVNEIYSDTFGWWSQPEIQKAREEFCHVFARTSETWLAEWKNGLLEIAGN